MLDYAQLIFIWPAISIFLRNSLETFFESQLSFKYILPDSRWNKSLKHWLNYGLGMRLKIENATVANKGTNQASNLTRPASMPLKYIKNDEGHFICPDCGVVKKNQNTMHYHMKKHEEQLTHICKACKKGFLQKQTLELHMRSKHPELIKDTSDDKKFKCPFDNCDFSALTKGNCIIHCLRVHFQDEIKEIMDIDNETKTIRCNECDCEFNSSCSFYYHCKGCMTFNKNEQKYEKLCEVIG